MASSTRSMIIKLQTACNIKGAKILYNTTQFYSPEQNRPIGLHVLKQAVWDEDKQKFINMELFKSASAIEVVLFLRDALFLIDGKELPLDNPLWNKRRVERAYSSLELFDTGDKLPIVLEEYNKHG